MASMPLNINYLTINLNYSPRSGELSCPIKFYVFIIPVPIKPILKTINGI